MQLKLGSFVGSQSSSINARYRAQMSWNINGAVLVAVGKIVFPSLEDLSYAYFVHLYWFVTSCDSAKRKRCKILNRECTEPGSATSARAV